MTVSLVLNVCLGLTKHRLVLMTASSTLPVITTDELLSQRGQGTDAAPRRLLFTLFCPPFRKVTVPRGRSKPAALINCKLSTDLTWAEDCRPSR